MRSTVPLPEHVRAMTEVIERTGFLLDTDVAADPWLRIAVDGVVRPVRHRAAADDHQLVVDYGTTELSALDAVPVRARDGQVLVRVEDVDAGLRAALLLSRQDDLLVLDDPFGRIADEVAAILAEERGPEGVSRKEVGRVLGWILHAGSAIPFNCATDPGKHRQVATTIGECCPRLVEYAYGLHVGRRKSPTIRRLGYDAGRSALAGAVTDVADRAVPVLAQTWAGVVIEVPRDDVAEVVARTTRPFRLTDGGFVPAVTAEVVPAN